YAQPRSLGRATGGTHALPVWTEYMKAAVAGREPVQRPLPEGLTAHAGDYVYTEYLSSGCVPDESDYLVSEFECFGGAAARAPVPAPPLPQAQEPMYVPALRSWRGYRPVE